ncbi:MAG: hypothetical protein ACR2M0_12570 [Chloroflexia bacterium]
METNDRRLIEYLLQHIYRAWRNGHRGTEVPGGQMVVLSNGLQVTVSLEPGPHAGQGGPDDTRLYLGVCHANRFPTYGEMQAIIGVVFSASQRGATNPLAVSTALHTPYLVLCSSRISRAA